MFTNSFMPSNSMREKAINRLVINMPTMIGTFLREYHAVGEIMPWNVGRERESSDLYVGLVHSWHWTWVELRGGWRCPEL
jgi:hypothetical protein